MSPSMKKTETLLPADLLKHEEDESAAVVPAARAAVYSRETIEIPSFTLSPEARATVARLYGNLRDSDHVIAVVGWDRADRSAELALQLGLGLASLTGDPVLLVDAAEERPHLHDLLGASASPGITELMAGNSTATAAIRQTNVKNFFFLPSGAPLESRSTAFSLPAWNQVIAALSEYPRAILHLGPLPQNARGTVIASHSDAAVAALAAGVRSRQEVIDLTKRIEALHIRLAGAVLTGNG